MNVLFSNQRRVRMWRGPLIVLCIPVFVLFTLCVLVSMFLPSLRPDSDAEFLKTFSKHKATFDRLVAMIEQDRELTRVGSDWTAPNPLPISQARLLEYRRVLAEVGCNEGFERNQRTRPGVAFIASSAGFVTGGWMKGYYYSEVPPKLLDDTLDGYPTSHDGFYDYEVYRHIQGNWYLYFRYES